MVGIFISNCVPESLRLCEGVIVHAGLAELHQALASQDADGHGVYP